MSSSSPSPLAPRHTFMSPFSRFRLLRRGASSTAGGHPPPQLLSVLSQPNVGSSPIPESGDISLSQHYAQMAQDLRSSLPPSCHWFGSGDIELVGGPPIAAGGFADIYEVTQCGHRAVLKSYRCYISFDVTRIVAVCYTAVSAGPTANNALVEVSKRGVCMDPPPPQWCGRGTAQRGVLDRGAPFLPRL